MGIDARDAAEFYATPLGELTARLVRRKLAALWPDCAGRALLGLGYAGPYLQAWRATAERCVALSPQQMGLAAWPHGRASLACLAEEEALPFQDCSFDRILFIHGLEQAENARRILREAWRLLRDDGKIIVVVPNRRGLWAYAEATPFGHGQPYSQGQLTRLLTGLLFEVESRSAALFAPPLPWRLNLATFDIWERCGHAIAPQFAGLTFIEARKDVLGVMPICRQLSVGSRQLVMGRSAAAVAGLSSLTDPGLTVPGLTVSGD
jgi:SAM-dependent methyltransferase